MGVVFFRRWFRLGRVIVASFLACSILTGCQLGPTVTTRQLIAHQAFVDFTGLAPAQTIDVLKISIAPPRDWEMVDTKKSAVYTHVQWQSPTHVNAVGVAYMKLPIALGAKTIAWLAKREYAKRSADGRILGEWTDAMNRPWFEAENGRFHVRGYVMSRGSEAWIVYYGYKVAEAPVPAEMSLAARSLETIVPQDDRAITNGESAQASAQ